MKPFLIEALADDEPDALPPAAPFDAVARLAAELTQCPMAYVALMAGEHLALTAAVGLEPGTDVEGASRQASLLGSEPIVDAQGQPQGQLAVLDARPRALSAVARQALRDLATLAALALDQRRLARELVHRAMTDELTGLSKPIHFHHALEAELAHAMRNGEPFTVLRMDLDGFKDVCDGFGHGAGEEVLQEVARRLAQQVRVGDVLCRLGDDAFAVVMRHGATEAARNLARRVVKAVSAPIVLGSGDEIGVGISIGMAAYDDHVVSARVLLDRAEQALLQARMDNERRWKMFVGIR